MNPLIYPSWWGDDVNEFKQAMLKRDRSQAPAATLENRIKQAREVDR